MLHQSKIQIRLIALVLLVLISLTASAQSPASKPNIVYIMADELGYFELSCVGNSNIKTPNIDRLAAQGIRFTQGLAGSSVCAPTRACLMTGKHSGHTSVRSNGGGTPLRAEEVTIASILKDVGYATGGFGKWGCGGRGSTGVPEEHGFDVFLGYYDQVHAHSYYPKYIVRNSEEVPLAGNHGLSNGDTYSHYVIFKAALDFIKANQNQPFFCYLPITPPHGIFDIPDEDPAWALYKDKDWPEQAKRYAAMVSMVDRQVGEVVTLLKQLGLTQNTVIFFCGDNGGADYFPTPDLPRGFHSANVNPETGVSFREKKGTLYEGGLRIPMMANWPGKIKGDRVSDLLWYFPDVMPTLAELAGAKVPDDIDGMSIVPELLGEQAAGRAQPQHDYLYWEIGGQTAVRMGQWKAIQPRKNRPWELYDLGRDVSEQNNLATSNSDILTKMKAYAVAAHEPVREGVFHNRAIHERDRRAKFGDSRQQANASAAPVPFPATGLIPQKQMKLVRCSSEADGANRKAVCAFDGNPVTHWHSEFQPIRHEHPYELVIDLGARRTVKGFRYLARQDNGWNGAFKACEFYVSNDPKAFGTLAVKTEFKKTKIPQDIACVPVTGRYVLVKVLSEINNGPWASAAEIGVIGD
ncbi:MAG: sulfatase-like hydrolase/transferase [Phycisphaerae bacterium]|nr:sulfatase-like hydrolase/transferase [Phycisphaerae bacterium]